MYFIVTLPACLALPASTYPSGVVLFFILSFLADTDKKFPVIGFGGKLGPDQPANHAFAVNFQEKSPEVDGMAGVLQVRAT